MMRRWTVALVGAGPVAQAIHLPTLAFFGERFLVTDVFDVDDELAARVAEPLGARVSTSMAELLAGRGFDVAVVGSPNQFHAEQIGAMCQAGVRGILAEKPLALTVGEAQRVIDAATSTALVVGAMHTYDPAWLAVLPHVRDRGPWHVRSAIYLPNNPRFEEMATTMTRPAPVPGTPVPSLELLRGGIMGLAIHDLSLIRRLIPRLDEVLAASVVTPWGYQITAAGELGSVELLARTGGTWRPDWTLSAWGAGVELALRFPPSYVHGGSAVASVRGATDATVFGPYPTDGYLGEWRELLAILDGAPPAYSGADLVADLAYATRLADLAGPVLNDRTAE